MRPSVPSSGTIPPPRPRCEVAEKSLHTARSNAGSRVAVGAAILNSIPPKTVWFPVCPHVLPRPYSPTPFTRYGSCRGMRCVVGCAVCYHCGCDRMQQCNGFDAPHSSFGHVQLMMFIDVLRRATPHAHISPCVVIHCVTTVMLQRGIAEQEAALAQFEWHELRCWHRSAILAIRVGSLMVTNTRTTSI